MASQRSNAAAASFKRPPTAQEAVTQELRRAILQGELAPGEQIFQDRFAEQFGVSRVPVREALKILEGEGQISYAPHRGYFVTELDLNELIEVYHIRNLLEAEAVRISVPKLTVDDDLRLEESIEETVSAAKENDIIALAAANRRFHFTLIEPCGMPRLIRIVRQMWDVTDPYRSIYFGNQEHRRTIDREHREILAAVRSRDTDRAIELLRAHREGTIASLRRLLEQQGTSA